MPISFPDFPPILVYDDMSVSMRFTYRPDAPNDMNEWYRQEAIKKLGKEMMEQFSWEGNHFTVVTEVVERRSSEFSKTISVYFGNHILNDGDSHDRRRSRPRTDMPEQETIPVQEPG